MLSRIKKGYPALVNPISRASRTPVRNHGRQSEEGAMPFIIDRMHPGRIVDTSTKLTPSALRSVSGAGFAGVARYVPLPGNRPENDIDAVELASILDNNLGLLLVQHVRKPPWDPALHPGVADASAAVEFARAAGYPEGGHIFVDLEGISGTALGTKKFAEDWAKAVLDAGYRAGCYVGFEVPLSPEQLFELRHINSYWSDAGPRAVATRGFAIKQQAGITIDGVRYDPDIVQTDKLGDTPFWLVNAPPLDIA
jgi:hypothetical protein